MIVGRNLFRRVVGVVCWAAMLMVSPSLYAQKEEVGPRCGKSYISESGPGFYWSDAANARCDDDESRTATAPLTKDQFSQVLKISNFGFKLPALVKVEGIEVVIIRKADVADAIQDRRVTLLKGNQSTGVSLHTTDRWDNDWTAAYYGDAKENWENTWTVADINAPGFGVAISVQCAGAIAQPQIDEILVTVHYSYGGESARGMRTTTQRYTCTPQ